MAEVGNPVHSHGKPMTTPKSDTPPLTVWLVEDYAPFRNTVSRLLNGTDGMACTHIFATAEDALRSLKTQAKPRAILVDVGEADGGIVFEGIEDAVAVVGIDVHVGHALQTVTGT